MAISISKSKNIAFSTLARNSMEEGTEEEAEAEVEDERTPAETMDKDIGSEDEPEGTCDSASKPTYTMEKDCEEEGTDSDEEADPRRWPFREKYISPDKNEVQKAANKGEAPHTRRGLVPPLA